MNHQYVSGQGLHRATPCKRESCESRRSFLKKAGAIGVVSSLGRLLEAAPAATADRASTLPALTSHPSIGPIETSAKCIVAHVKAKEVIAGIRIHGTLLGEMIETGVRVATKHQGTSGEMWHSLFSKDDVIGIKFNQVGGQTLGTTVPMAIQLVDLLGQAGFAPDRIVLIEAPDTLEIRQLKTKPRVHDWSGKKVDFGSGAEQLDAVLQEVTAIINVPFLKTHNIAGMSGCLKNLSHALIRRPKLYHEHMCAPYVGDIVALPAIRSKLRLHIVNVLRGVFDGGPEARRNNVWEHSGLLISTDPVAADAVGTDILNEQRARAKLPAIGDANGHIPHVHAAARRGLGTDDQDYISLIQPSMF